MPAPLIHAICLSEQSASLLALFANDIDPTAVLVRHSSLENFYEHLKRGKHETWQVAVTELQTVVKNGTRDGAFVPMVYCSPTEAHPSGSPSQQGQSPQFPVVAEQLPKYLQEACAAAQWFRKLSLGLDRLSELAEREYRVLSLASDGIPNKSIARRLGVSVKTIEQCRRSAYRKLGIKSAAEVGSLLTLNKISPLLSPAPHWQSPAPNTIPAF